MMKGDDRSHEEMNCMQTVEAEANEAEWLRVQAIAVGTGAALGCEVQNGYVMIGRNCKQERTFEVLKRRSVDIQDGLERA